jgi:protoheme IX farnesyltransferase
MLGERADSRLSFAQLRRELTVLFKLRIVYLLLAAATAGAFLAAAGWPGRNNLVILLLAGLLSAAGSSALNEYLERDTDALMNRTRNRPLVSGRLGSTNWVPWVAAAMVVAPPLLLLPVNPALSFFLFLGAFIYVVIYTLWLKPRTSLNIVIGGAAGSCAVLSGSAAAGAWSDPGALLLAALVFLWTPIHFWSLALVYREDYARAKVPMLPVRTTPRRAAVWGLLHGLGAGACAVAMAFLPGLSLFYAVPALAMTAILWWAGIALVIDPSKRRAYRLFHASNFYLLIILLAVLVGTLVKAP